MATTAMRILERDQQLALIARRFAAIGPPGEGSCIVLSGEAGIGKTTLVRAFGATLPASVPVLQCGCEALFTPRPLGPLLDIAASLPPSLDHALRQGPGNPGLFPALLRYFADARRPRVLIVEDLHWADAGTLDLLRYISRRVRDLPLLLVLTLREEVLDDAHPLRLVLGAMPPAQTLRLQLQPLSRDAVDEMARASGRSDITLYAATGGNPFYVTELLAAPAHAVPESVRDAVLGGLAQVSASARKLVQTACLLPGRAELRILTAVDAVAPSAIDECLRARLLQTDGAALVFRHEIVRNVVLESFSPVVRSEGHARIYRALTAQDDAQQHLARRVHHAEAAGLWSDLAGLAPMAAREAAAAGDHGEAGRLYRLALVHGPARAEGDEADLLEAQAHECMLVNRHTEAMACRERAMALRHRVGDTLREAVNLRWLARLHWQQSGSGPEAYRLAQEAIERLQALPPDRELAMACTTLSHICLGGDDFEGAQRWGLRAIELAEASDDAEALCHALTNVGAARLRTHDDALAWNRLHRALEVALAHGYQADAARAFNNLFLVGAVHHDFALALKYADEGIGYCEARGLDVFTVRIRIRRAFAQLKLGQWEIVDEELEHLSRWHTPSPMEAATRNFVASLLDLRRGAKQAVQRLETVIQSMSLHRAGLWFTSSEAVRAEAAWLGEDGGALLPEVEADIRRALANLRRIGDRWGSGELAVWLHRFGSSPGIPTVEVADPYARELAGDWVGASEAWNRLGCPYDRALAMSGGDEAAQRQAVVVFEALGALPGAERLRRRLRAQGARGVPRGPQTRTRDDPLGLTAREREIFEWARQGLTVTDMAQRLFRSERTVENHVAKLYRKLGVRSRTELVARHPLPDPAGKG